MVNKYLQGKNDRVYLIEVPKRFLEGHIDDGPSEFVRNTLAQMVFYMGGNGFDPIKKKSKIKNSDLRDRIAGSESVLVFTYKKFLDSITWDIKRKKNFSGAEYDERHVELENMPPDQKEYHLDSEILKYLYDPGARVIIGADKSLRTVQKSIENLKNNDHLPRNLSVKRIYATLPSFDFYDANFRPTTDGKSIYRKLL